MEKITFEDATIITPPQVNINDGFNIGSIIQFAGATIPSGWLLCDGSAISRTTYEDLFDAIGTTYGTGDGSTTFNLPNLKGRVAVGKDTSQTEFDTLGETGGSKFLQEHDHKLQYSLDGGQTFGEASFGRDGTYTGVDSYNGTSESVSLFSQYQVKISKTGIGDSGNLQPYITLNYIIKAISQETSLNVIDAVTSGGTDLNANTFNTMQDNIENAIVDSYSISEVKTNKVWIDNKPIYRQVISFTTPNSASDFNIGNISNISNLISLKGIVDNKLPIPNDWANQFSVSLRINSGVVQGRIDWEDYYNKSGYAIIEYTKTTD